ncbi:MAG: hypothetical protein RSC98_04685 [Clostridia bacterium]
MDFQTKNPFQLWLGTIHRWIDLPIKTFFKKKRKGNCALLRSQMLGTQCIAGTKENIAQLKPFQFLNKKQLKTSRLAHFQLFAMTGAMAY